MLETILQCWWPVPNFKLLTICQNDRQHISFQKLLKFCRILIGWNSALTQIIGLKWVIDEILKTSVVCTVLGPPEAESFSFREMISLFLLIFAFQNGIATEDGDLRQIVNNLQSTMNKMSGKMIHLESEVKVRVILEVGTWKKIPTFLVIENYPLSSRWKIKINN